jgi:hypothetical protein
VVVANVNATTATMTALRAQDTDVDRITGFYRHERTKHEPTPGSDPRAVILRIVGLKPEPTQPVTHDGHHRVSWRPSGTRASLTAWRLAITLRRRVSVTAP